MTVHLLAAMDELYQARRDVLAARESVMAAIGLAPHGHRADGWTSDAIKLIDSSRLALEGARRHLAIEEKP